MPFVFFAAIFDRKMASATIQTFSSNTGSAICVCQVILIFYVEKDFLKDFLKVFFSKILCVVCRKSEKNRLFIQGMNDFSESRSSKKKPCMILKASRWIKAGQLQDRNPFVFFTDHEKNPRRCLKPFSSMASKHVTLPQYANVFMAKSLPTTMSKRNSNPYFF